ncbi:MAG: YqhA family protein [Prevotellaceae bacterium]|jgi:uncharacterized membrane protein YqhA|nr:YqhA family protein [Prevotellaceae bacterium]
MNILDEIKKSILDEGVITEKKVIMLREALYDDGGITKEKANILFELKNAFENNSNHASWETLFIDSITNFLLEDDDSPGSIDDDEAQWLRAKIQRDGRLSRIDKALLENLKKQSINFPEILHYKNRHVLFFETVLYSSRFVTFLAVIGSLLASVALFVLSTIRVAEGLIDSVKAITTSENGAIEHVIAKFVSAIDGYLFSTVLFIFGMGIYELFISKIDVVSKRKDSRPNWLMIGSIDDLKSSLGKVILMILIVSFFEHSLNMKYENISDLLLLGVGIILISAALFLTHVHIKHKEK